LRIRSWTGPREWGVLRSAGEERCREERLGGERRRESKIPSPDTRYSREEKKEGTVWKKRKPWIETKGFIQGTSLAPSKEKKTPVRPSFRGEQNVRSEKAKRGGVKGGKGNKKKPGPWKGS